MKLKKTHFILQCCTRKFLVHFKTHSSTNNHTQHRVLTIMPRLVLWLCFCVLACAITCTQLNRNGLFKKELATMPHPPHVVSQSRLAEWERCPKSMQHVVKRYAGAGKGYFTIGCCPPGHKGLTLPREDRIVGCCPVNQTFAYDRVMSHVRFRGCVDSICQVGRSQICPTGKGFCRGPKGLGGVCAPHNGDPCDFDAYCTAHNKTAILDVAWNTPYSARDTFGIDVHHWKGYNYRTRLYEDRLSGEGSFIGNTLTPPVRLCNGTGMICHESETCNLEQVNVTTTNGTVVDQYNIETYCCPDTHTVCESRASNHTELQIIGNITLVEIAMFGEFLGCAPPGEICCGRNICPPDHKCCDLGISGKFCCPTELQCCFGNPYLVATEQDIPPNQRNVERGYCGMAINGRNCSMDRMTTGSLYQLHRGRGLLTNLFP